MTKLSVAATCALLVAAMVAPGQAKDHSITGFLQTKAIMANIGLEKDAKPDRFIDQRFRAKWKIAINEYVAVVYFGEVDFQYGDSAYNLRDGARGVDGGGAIGGDQNNLETKNLYMDVRVPDTPISFRLGLQSFAAPDYALFLFDGAGLTLDCETDLFDAQFGYAKLIEGGADSEGRGRVESIGSMAGEDDADFYYLKGSAMPLRALRVGTGLYWLRNGGVVVGTEGTVANYSNSYLTNDFDEYFVVVDASYELPLMTISGWIATAFGSVEKAMDTNGDGRADDIDLGGFAATVKISGKAAGVSWGARAIYWSGDDDRTDSKNKGLYTPFADGAVVEVLPFAKDGFMLMLSDVTTTTYDLGFRGFAMDGAAYSGYGLWAVTLNGSFVPASRSETYLKGAIGYFSALEDDQTPGDGVQEKRGTSLGTEIAARAGYKLADVVDLSINGAYALLGDFFDNTATSKDGTATDPDNAYILYLMAKVGF